MQCRICKNTELDMVINLGEQCLASVFPSNPNEKLPSAKLELIKCRNCHLVQLSETIPQHLMYETNAYGYRSGINETMKRHLQEIVSEAETKYNLKEQDNVLDIGSNDCTLLNSYTIPVKKHGIDPTGKQFKQYYSKDVSLICDYFSAHHFSVKFKVVTSIAMFYDLPDPLQFMRDIASVLDKDGVWITEQSYLPLMIENNSFDTICHEHLEYYTLHQIVYMAEQSGLRVVDVSLNESNGGSFRVALVHNDADIYCPISVSRILYDEIQYKTLTPFVCFMDRCNRERDKLLYLLDSIKREGGSIYLYGASTKGNTLLQYYNIDTSLVDGAAERNPNKYGLYTPATNIPILSEAEVRARNPTHMLVLPWHFKQGILDREKEFLNRGGALIFPLPELEVVKQLS